MIVAIDGPSGSGKSTVAREIAKIRDITYLDTGAMYRCVTLVCLEQSIDLDSEEKVGEVAENIEISFSGSAENAQVFIDEREVTRDIRTPEIDLHVSQVSAYPRVRRAMVDIQRSQATHGDVVAEGRDIGTVVFPDADVKVFLTASAESRALRRSVQRCGGDLAKGPVVEVSEAEIERTKADLERRDAYDSSRKESPLKPAEDAIILDSSDMTLDEVCNFILECMDRV